MDDAKPLFIQLAEQIEGRILDGTYPEETQVPSTNEFAAFLRINPATAGKGLARLVEAGVLYKRRGDRHVRGPGGPAKGSCAPARMLALLGGDRTVLPQLLGVPDAGDPSFNIVTP